MPTTPKTQMMYKVLIAEDDMLISAVISQILSELKIGHKIVNSGRALLNEYHKNYYDMVLLDIMMPKMSGFQVSKELRKMDSHIPIVAFTSLLYKDIEQDLSESGINHYVGKPPHNDDLKELLQEYFYTAA